MRCKYCDAELPAGTHGKRAFCNNAHKQAYWRKVQQEDQIAAETNELVELRRKVRNQAQTIEEQDQEITLLKRKLSIEQYYLADRRNNKKHTFLAWLKKQPASPLTDKILAAGPQLSQNDSCKYYEYRLRVLLHCSEAEMEEFVELWKLMLLS